MIYELTISMIVSIMFVWLLKSDEYHCLIIQTTAISMAWEGSIVITTMTRGTDVLSRYSNVGLQSHTQSH